jgi:hypothetical protein
MSGNGKCDGAKRNLIHHVSGLCRSYKFSPHCSCTFPSLFVEIDMSLYSSFFMLTYVNRFTSFE